MLSKVWWKNSKNLTFFSNLHLKKVLQLFFFFFKFFFGVGTVFEKKTEPKSYYHVFMSTKVNIIIIKLENHYRKEIIVIFSQNP